MATQGSAVLFPGKRLRNSLEAYRGSGTRFTSVLHIGINYTKEQILVATEKTNRGRVL